MQFEDEHDGLNAGNAGLESALKSLVPVAAAKVDPLAAAFAAGRRSSRQTIRAWQSAAAVMFLLAGGSWAMRLATVLPRPSAIVVELPATATPRAQAAGDQTLIMLQRAVEDHGIDGLPASPLPSVRMIQMKDIL
jgi:hypothetical protein